MRMRWTEETFKKKSNIELSDLEASSTQTVFAKEIFSKLAVDSPNADFYWILGEDQLDQLSFWKDIDTYAQNLHWVVFPRSENRAKPGLMSKRLMRSSAAYSWTKTRPMVDVSSHRLREQLAAHQKPAELEWIAPAIQKEVCETYQKGR